VIALLRGPEPDERPAAQREAEQNEAVRLAQAGPTVMPANARAAQLAYEALNLTGRREQALAAAREWRTRTPVDAFLPDVAIADLLLRSGEPEEALSVLLPWRERLVAEASEQRALGLNLLGQALAASGRADEAHELLWDRAQDSEVWRGVYLNVATVVRPAEEADAWIDRLDELTTTPIERIALANAAFNAATRAPTAARFERTLEIAAPLADDEEFGLPATMLSGVSAENLGDLEGAMGWYRRAIDAGYEEPVAYNNLAYLQYSEGGSAEEAVELAQRAVALGESQGRSAVELATFHDSLAEILTSLGRVEEAETHYRRAVELSPTEPRYRVGLAEALAAKGLLQEALAEVLRAEALLQGRADEALERRLGEVRETIDSMG
jgi:Flp pilus assembly protein TadD